ncbi:MAG: hypothetical protein AAF447_23045 [Myxococcota bacterium]
MRAAAGLLLLVFASLARAQGAGDEGAGAEGAEHEGESEPLAIALRVSACGEPWAAPETLGPALRLELAGVGRRARLDASALRRVEVRVPDCARPAELELQAREGSRLRRAETSLADVLPESRPRVLALVLAELVVALDAPAPVPSEARQLAPPRAPEVLDVRLASVGIRRSVPGASRLSSTNTRWGLSLRAGATFARSLEAAPDEGAWLGGRGGLLLHLPGAVRVGVALTGVRAGGRARLEGINGRVRGRRVGAALEASWLPGRGRLRVGPELAFALERLRAEGRLGRGPTLVQRSAVASLRGGVVAELRLGRGVALWASLAVAVPVRGYVATAETGARVLGWSGLALPASVGLSLPLAGATRPGVPLVRVRGPVDPR